MIHSWEKLVKKRLTDKQLVEDEKWVRAELEKLRKEETDGQESEDSRIQDQDFDSSRISHVR